MFLLALLSLLLPTIATATATSCDIRYLDTTWRLGTATTCDVEITSAAEPLGNWNLDVTISFNVNLVPSTPGQFASVGYSEWVAKERIMFSNFPSGGTVLGGNWRVNQATNFASLLVSNVNLINTSITLFPAFAGSGMASFRDANFSGSLNSPFLTAGVSTLFRYVTITIDTGDYAFINAYAPDMNSQMGFEFVSGNFSNPIVSAIPENVVGQLHITSSTINLLKSGVMVNASVGYLHSLSTYVSVISSTIWCSPEAMTYSIQNNLNPIQINDSTDGVGLLGFQDSKVYNLYIKTKDIQLRLTRSQLFD